MTFKPSRQKVILRRRSTPQIERLCSVSGTLPKEVRVAFEKKNQVIVAGSERVSTEKLMPCGMRYPEPFRARPNFFIPILAVGSYVVPYLMLLLLSQNVSEVPLAGSFIQYLHQHVDKIYVPPGLPNSTLALLFMSLPMLVGGLLAVALSKNKRLSLDKKLLIWFLPICLLVVFETFFGALLTNENPQPARETDSAHH